MFRVRELIEYGKTLDPMRFEKRLFIGGGEGNWGGVIGGGNWGG